MRRFLISSLRPLFHSSALRLAPPRFFSSLSKGNPEEEQKIKPAAISSSESPIVKEKKKKKKKKRVAFKTFEEVMNQFPEVKRAAGELTEEERIEILDALNTPDDEIELEMPPNPSPGSQFIGPKQIEWIQTNPAYSDSLEHAVERDYLTSLGLMWVAYKHFEKEVGPCNEHLLYIIRRILWIGRLGGRERDTLEIIEKGYSIAKQLYTQPEHEEKLRFYEELLVSNCFLSDVSKALLVSQNVLERRQSLKERDPLGELTFSFYQATATALTGDLEEGIKKSEALYEKIGKQVKELGKQSEKLLSGTLINLGVMKFELVKAEGERKARENEMWTEQQTQRNGKSIEECIFLFKAAVNIAENVPERFGTKEGQTLSKAQKLFKDLFDPSDRRFIGAKKPDYSLKDRVENDALIKACFTTKEGALGVMNLGYMAHHMHAPQEALIYFDIASRAFGGIENGESLHGKAMSFLAASFGQLHGNERMTRELFEKVLEKTGPESVERAETLDLYGRTLMKEEPTKFEGEEMVMESFNIQGRVGDLNPIKRLMIHPEVSKKI